MFKVFCKRLTINLNFKECICKFKYIKLNENDETTLSDNTKASFNKLDLQMPLFLITLNLESSNNLKQTFLRNLFKLAKECNAWIVTNGIAKAQIKQIGVVKNQNKNKNIVLLGLSKVQKNVS